MIDQWKKQLNELSGNLTTNEPAPQEIIDKLLDEDESLKDEIRFEEVKVDSLSGILNGIKGLDIIAYLQRLQKEGNLTLFRAIRFPTYKRLYDILYEHGYRTPNYEQERILELYNRNDYNKKRNEIKSDNCFWTQPQERVVQGLPLFCLVNDALQIHRAYRGETDKVAIVAVHIPYNLLESNKIKLTANTAIDLDLDNTERDIEINDFIKSNGILKFDFSGLRAKGIELHEMYSNDLPWTNKEAEKIGITEDFFLLDIYKIKDWDDINKLFDDVETLKNNKSFLHGFFGDQNIFGRRKSYYLPSSIQKIIKR